MSNDQVLKALDAINARLTAIEASIASGGGAGGGSGGGAAAEAPAGAAASAYQDIIDEFINPFKVLSETIGGDVAPLGQLVLDAALATKALIQTASESKKPGDADLPAILKPLSSKIEAINNYRDEHRATKEKNFLWAIAESSGNFGWVAVPKTPAPFSKEMGGAAAFYTNKILREFKGKDDGKDKVEWAKAYTGYINALFGYIKQHHTTGLTWNPKGGAAKPPTAAAAAPAAAKAAAPAKKPAPRAARAAAGPGLFAELNKGGAVTSGLKKVDRSQTNKDKKISGVVKAAPSKRAASKPKQPPVCELRGNKWCLDFLGPDNSPHKIKVEKKQTVYLYKCENAVVVIEGRCNSICIDNCKKTGVVFDGCVSTCEIVNSQSIKAQVKESVPTVSIDKTAGAQIILNPNSMETEIVSGTSSEMNVSWFPDGADADPVEHPLPEQFKTKIVDNKLVTEPVDHSGG